MSQHEDEIVKYLTFARLNRGQQLHSIDGIFKDVKGSRLYEETFTLDEVQELLDDLCGVVKSEVESELINVSHTNVLLLRQLFLQAEKWHLSLQTDISELENRRLLEEIATFEEQKFSNTTKEHEVTPLMGNKSKLEPLNESGRVALLNEEIKRLQEENDTVKKKLRVLELKVSETLDDKAKLKDRLEALAIHPNPPLASEACDEPDDRRLIHMQQHLKEAETKYKSTTSSLEDELTQTKRYVLALKKGIDNLEKEMEKKFSETTQYNNMKKMLETKNNLIKRMRQHLKSLDPSFEL